MRVLFYTDRVMHYHVSLFRMLEQRLRDTGGTFVLVSGKNKQRDTGRIGLSNVVVSQHLFVPFYEWTHGTYAVRWQPTLTRTVAYVKPDIVVVMGHVSSVTYWRLGRLRKRIGFKYVTWQCGYEYNPGRLKYALTNRFLQRFDYHLAYHTNAKKYLVAHGAAESRIMVVYNTINEQEFQLLPRLQARQQVTTELGLPPGRPIVLYVGAILAEKRLEMLIDTIRHLGRDAVSLVIVGDGPARPGLQAASADLDCVKYPGRVLTGVGRYFDAADVFVLPGTGGLALNEAMAHRLPVISGYADGSAEDLITDGVNGYLLKKGSAGEIAMRLKELLYNPAVRTRMGEVSRKRITTKYSFQAFIDRIMQGLHTALHSA